MSILSVSTHIARIWTEAKCNREDKFENEDSAYKQNTHIEDSARESADSIKRNSRTKIWTPRDLGIFSNSELLYAISPVAIALFLGNASSNCAANAIFYDIRELNTLSECDRCR